MSALVVNTGSGIFKMCEGGRGRWSGGWKSHSGSRSKALVQGLGDFVPWSWSLFVNECL